jgi:hypothetical protein
VNGVSYKDERLRQALDRVAEVAGNGEACPPSERLVLSGRGELETKEEVQVILHLARCTACATGWKIAREVAAGGAPLSFPARDRPIVTRGWFRVAAAAAVAVVAVGLGVVFLTPERELAPVYRTQEGRWLSSDVDEEKPLPRGAFVLRWTAGPEGTLYDVRVLSEELEPIASAKGLDRTEYQVPEEALAELASGSRVLWQVTAILPDAQRVESETFFAVVE